MSDELVKKVEHLAAKDTRDFLKSWWRPSQSLKESEYSSTEHKRGSIWIDDSICLPTLYPKQVMHYDCGILKRPPSSSAQRQNLRDGGSGGDPAS